MFFEFRGPFFDYFFFQGEEGDSGKPGKDGSPVNVLHWTKKSLFWSSRYRILFALCTDSRTQCGVVAQKHAGRFLTHLNIFDVYLFKQHIYKANKAPCSLACASSVRLTSASGPDLRFVVSLCLKVLHVLLLVWRNKNETRTSTNPHQDIYEDYAATVWYLNK